MSPRLKQWFGRRPPEGDGPRVPRVLAYCASNVGMGHYCRLLRVLGELRRRRPELDILLATDAPDLSLAHQSGLATLQLPRFAFVDSESFKERPERLSIPSRDLRDLRAELLLAAGRRFAPDLLIADTNPHGKRDELLPLLRHRRRAGRGRNALLMRDIPCPPGEDFKLSGKPAEIERHAAYYDRILLAGDARFFDPARAYGWSEPIQRRTTMLGFIVPEVRPLTREQALADFPALNPAHPLVVASFGGGWEVEPMLEQLLRGIVPYRRTHQKPVQLIAVTGPAFGEDALTAMRAQASAVGGVEIARFLPGFPALLLQADLAVLQAGSTPFQLLESDIPILLTVRDYKSREQAERAARLAALPAVWLVERDTPEWDDSAAWIAWGLDHPRVPRETGLKFDGVTRAAEALDAELGTALGG